MDKDNRFKIKIVYLIILFVFLLITIFCFKENPVETADSQDAVCKIMFDSSSIYVSDVSKAIVDGQTVTIGKEGQYYISGYSSDAKLVVDTMDLGKVRLYFENLELTSIGGAPLNVLNSGDVELFISGHNFLKDADIRGEMDKSNGCFYSKKDVTIQGDGELIIEGNYKHGLSVRADCNIDSGNITVRANKNAIDVKDNLHISGGEINLYAAGDGINAKNNDDDTKGVVEITGGVISIDSEDEGIFGKESVKITGGDVSIASTGMIIRTDGYKDIDNERVHADYKGEKK